MANPLFSQTLTKLKCGEIATANKLSRQLVEGFPADSEHWLLRCRVLLKQNDLAAAANAAAKANALADGESAVALALHAHCQMKLGAFAQARKAATEILSLPDVPASTLDTAGVVLSHCHCLSLAAQCFERAAKIQATNAHYLFNHATALRSLGRLEQSEQILNDVLERDPRYWEAYLARSALRRQTRERNHINLLLNALSAAGLPDAAVINLNYALGKEFEDLGQYPQAFERFQSAGDKRRQRSDYQVSHDVSTMAQIADAYPASLLASRRHCVDANDEAPIPIFILGLPRTGSTLLEQIFSAHPEVFAAGELQNFAVELIKATAEVKAEPIIDKREFVRRSANVDFETVGQRYMRGVEDLFGRHRYFTDKMPLNFLYLGPIHLALPSARIIHIVRSPMDTCFAIYKTLFNQAYPYSYTLADIAEYYAAYARLMAHWHRCLGDRIIPVQYEQLVDSAQQIGQSLFTACGLDWDDRYTNVAASENPTATASSAQVRDTIHCQSVGRWRCYERQLAPLFDALQARGLDPERASFV